MNQNKKLFLSLFIIALLVGLDQVTKKLALHFLSEKSIDIIPKVFSLTLLEGGNSGAAFGLLQGGFWFFMLTTWIVIFFSMVVLRRLSRLEGYLPLLISMILLLSGAFGNLIDRISTKVEYGSSFVVDFLYFEWIDFPIFNVADCYVSCSAFLLLVLGTFYYKEKDYEIILGRKRGNQA